MTQANPETRIVRHTDGEWFALGTNVFTRLKPTSPAVFVCTVGIGNRSLQEADANARLIAAAPKTLELLARALDHVAKPDLAKAITDHIEAVEGRQP